jgi:protein SCO1
MNRLTRSQVGVLLVVSMVGIGCAAETQLHGLTRSTPLTVGDQVLPDVTDPAVRAGGVVDDNQLTFTADEGRFLAVYFGFLQCPDICPTTLMDLRVALERVDSAVAERIDVVFVTVDPERDTPEALGAYLQYFFSRYHAVRDDGPALQRTLDAFLASAEVQRDASGTVVDVAHTAVLYLVDAHGNVVIEWPFGTRAQMIADDLMSLAATVLAGER